MLATSSPITEKRETIKKRIIVERRPVFTIEAFEEVFLIKFIEIGKSDQYRLEINLTGSNIVKFKK